MRAAAVWWLVNLLWFVMPAVGAELLVVSGFPELESQYYVQSFVNATGYSVHVESYPPGVLVSLLENDLLVADVIIGLPVEMLVQLQQKGLTRSFVSDHVTHLAEEFYDPSGGWYAQFIDAITVVYIPDILRETGLEPPSSWSQLREQRWKNQIIMASPVTSSTGFSTYALWGQLFGIESETFRTITGNIDMHTRRDATPAAILAQGDHALAVLSFNTALTYLGRGVPLKVAWMEEGNGMVAVGLALARDANHPAAQIFADYLLSVDGQNLPAMSARYRRPIRADAYVPPWIITLDRMQLAFYDWSAAGRQRDVLLDVWNSLIVGDSR